MVNTQTHVNTHPRAYHKLYATSTALVLIDEAVFLLDRAKTDVQRDGIKRPTYACGLPLFTPPKWCIFVRI